MFTKWSDPDGKVHWGVDLVYLTPDQMRAMPLPGQGGSLVIFPVSLEGLEQNEAGLYNEEDLLGRFDQAIAAYDTIVETYSDNVPAEVTVQGDCSIGSFSISESEVPGTIDSLNESMVPGTSDS